MAAILRRIFCYAAHVSLHVVVGNRFNVAIIPFLLCYDRFGVDRSAWIIGISRGARAVKRGEIDRVEFAVFAQAVD